MAKVNGKKSNGWIKIVIVIIVLELVVGGVLFAYKKLFMSKDGSNSVSVKDKKIVALYNKINYFDIDTLDVMSPMVMLYYGYNNIETKESISCDVAKPNEVLEGYSCEGVTDFVKSSDLEKAVKSIYGKNIAYDKVSFAVDSNRYLFYDEVNDGFVLYKKSSTSNIEPINTKLKEAVKDDDKIVLTVEELDGLVGTLINTYKFTFEKDGSSYVLVSKEIVTK